MKKIAYLLLPLLLCGCAVQDDERPGPENGGICLTPGVAAIGGDVDGMATRAAATEPLAEGTTLRIVAYTAASMTSASYAGEGCYVMDGGSLKPCTTDADGKVLTKGGVTDGLWLRGGASYHFFAVTPAIATDHTQTPPAVNVKHGMDFASSLTSGSGGGITVAKGSTSASVTLNTLERKCTHISFAFDRVWTNVTSIAIQSVSLSQMTDEPQQAAGTGDLPTDAAHTRTVTLGEEHFTTDATDTWLASGGGIVLPKASAKLDLTLKVCFNGSTTPTELTATGIAAIAFLKGLDYTFRVKLRDGVVVLTLEVAPWTVHTIGGDAGTPPVDGGTGPWDDTESNGEAGTSPHEIVVGSWTNVIWNGDSGGGSSQVQPPGWEGSTSDGTAGAGTGSIIISGWQGSSWNGSIGSSSEIGYGWGQWTTHESVQEVE